MVVAAAGIILGLVAFGLATRLFYKLAEHHHDENYAQVERHHTERLVAMDHLTDAVKGGTASIARETAVAAKSSQAVADSLQPLVTTLAAELQAHMDFIETNQRELRTRVETGPGSKIMRVP